MKFTELLSKFHIPFVAEGRYASQGWINFFCPFCDGGSDPEKPYCGYNLSGNYVNCWRCGSHPLGKTLMALAGISWHQAKELLGDIEREDGLVLPKRGKLVLPDGLAPLLPVHKKYLRKRGFDPEELVRLWGLQGIGLTSRLAWRIFIPMVYQGETVSWTTRKVGEDVPKGSSRYISARPDQEIFNHKELLYGIDYARHAVVVVEGPTDAWRVGPGAVATMGTGIKPKQLLRLSNFLVRAVCFDNEPSAQRRARTLADNLTTFPGNTYVVSLQGKDPGSASDREIKQLRKEFLE